MAFRLACSGAAALGVAALLTACASAGPRDPSPARDAADLAGMFEGRRDLAPDPRASALETSTDTPPAAGRTFIAVDAPEVEGVLLVVLRHGAGGVSGPVERAALRRFRDGEGVILNDYLSLKEPDAWGDLTVDRSALTALSEADLRFNAGCTMRWRWAAQAQRYEGRTTDGACISTRIADSPTRIDARHRLSPTQFVHDSRYFSLDGAPRRSDAQPDIYRRLGE